MCDGWIARLGYRLEQHRWGRHVVLRRRPELDGLGTAYINRLNGHLVMTEAPRG